MAPLREKEFKRWLRYRVVKYFQFMFIWVILFFKPVIPIRFHLAELFWAPYIAPFATYLMWKPMVKQFRHAIVSRLFDAGIENPLEAAKPKIKIIDISLTCMSFMYLMCAIFDSFSLLLVSLIVTTAIPLWILNEIAKLPSINKGESDYLQ